MDSESLTEREIERYSRQLLLKSWSAAEQLHFRKLHVLVPDTLPTAASYLAAAGVGRISLLHTSEQGGELLSRLQAFNSDIEVLPWADEPTLTPPHCIIRHEQDKEAALLSADIPVIEIGSRKSGLNVRFLVPLGSSAPQWEGRELPLDFSTFHVKNHLLAGTLAAGMVISWWRTTFTHPLPGIGKLDGNSC